MIIKDNKRLTTFGNLDHGDIFVYWEHGVLIKTPTIMQGCHSNNNNTTRLLDGRGFFVCMSALVEHKPNATLLLEGE